MNMLVHVISWLRITDIEKRYL